jgi:hypothetical protein
MSVTRRQFLRGTAAAGATLALPWHRRLRRMDVPAALRVVE